MGIAEPRYARALYALQAETGPEEIRRSAEYLDALAEYFTEDGPVGRFMYDPLIPAAARRDAAVKLLPGDAPENLKNLIGVLADRKRLALLPGVAAAYRGLLTETGDLLYIEISSAYQLEEEQYKRLGEVFARRRNAKAFKVVSGVDKSLLGGVRVRIGDTVYDGTLKMKLVRYKELLA